MEELLYNSQTMRGFVGIDLGREPVPDGKIRAAIRLRITARSTISTAAYFYSLIYPSSTGIQHMPKASEWRRFAGGA